MSSTKLTNEGPSETQTVPSQSEERSETIGDMCRLSDQEEEAEQGDEVEQGGSELAIEVEGGEKQSGQEPDQETQKPKKRKKSGEGQKTGKKLRKKRKRMDRKRRKSVVESTDDEEQSIEQSRGEQFLNIKTGEMQYREPMDAYCDEDSEIEKESEQEKQSEDEKRSDEADDEISDGEAEKEKEVEQLKQQKEIENEQLKKQQEAEQLKKQQEAEQLKKQQNDDQRKKEEDEMRIIQEFEKDLIEFRKRAKENLRNYAGQALSRKARIRKYEMLKEVAKELEEEEKANVTRSAELYKMKGMREPPASFENRYEDAGIIKILDEEEATKIEEQKKSEEAAKIIEEAVKVVEQDKSKE